MHPESGSDAPHFDGHLRPWFVRHVDCAPDDVLARLRDALTPDAPCCGSVAGDVVELCVCHRKRHMWSPKLSLTVRHEREQTLIQGRYGPMPAVWTFVVFAYACALALGIASAVYAGSQSILGNASPAWWGVLASALLLIGIYAGSYVGQKLGHPQMEILHHFVDGIVRGDPVAPCEDIAGGRTLDGGAPCAEAADPTAPL